MGALLGGVLLLEGPAQAQVRSLFRNWGQSFLRWENSSTVGSLNAFCQQPAAAVARKEQLRQQASQSDQAWAGYTQIVAEHRAALLACRSRRWPPIQAIWVRLHPCDANPGVLERVFDQVVNLGYNRVLIETFYDGRSILPAADAAGGVGTWPPSLQPDADLLQLALKAARQRGLSAYAWVFSLNFGYSYGQRPDRQGVLARNGRGMTTLFHPAKEDWQEDWQALASPDEVFVDPFHPLARQDFASLIKRLLQRRPDGILFDYIRYPRGLGAASLATTVKDLWIYGEAAQQAYLDLAENAAGRALLQRYLDQGYVTVADVLQLDQLYAEEPRWRWPGSAKSNRAKTAAADRLSPELWDDSTYRQLVRAAQVQGETQKESHPTPSPTPTPNAATRQRRWQEQLWSFSVDFARHGILEYLNQAVNLARSHGIPAGAVFFPDGNQAVGGGFDSRLQPWDRFDPTLEWHPMAYAKCENASCVVEQVEKVLAVAPPRTFVCPAIAGFWGQSQRQRPALEVQMGELARRFPQLPCVSHFALSWIEPELERSRQSCQL